MSILHRYLAAMPSETFRVVMDVTTFANLLADRDALHWFWFCDASGWTLRGRPVEVSRAVEPGDVQFMTREYTVSVKINERFK